MAVFDDHVIGMKVNKPLLALNVKVNRYRGKKELIGVANTVILSGFEEIESTGEMKATLDQMK